jgi:hypothetical protein
MAKVVDPLLSNAASGSTSGIVLSTSKFGTTAHAKKCCSKANSISQLEQQCRTADLSREWAKLTASQRKGWDRAAPKGLSGFNMYMSKSLTASRVWGSIVSVLIPSPNEIIYTQDCTPIIQDGWLQLDSGYQQTGYHFADLHVSPTNYFGKKLTIDMCPLHSIIMTAPGEILDTGIFLPHGYSIVYMRFVSHYTGNASPFIIWEILS